MLETCFQLGHSEVLKLQSLDMLPGNDLLQILKILLNKTHTLKYVEQRRQSASQGRWDSSTSWGEGGEDILNTCCAETNVIKSVRKYSFPNMCVIHMIGSSCEGLRAIGHPNLLKLRDVDVLAKIQHLQMSNILLQKTHILKCVEQRPHSTWQGRWRRC
jgi:hypothetical protein